MTKATAGSQYRYASEKIRRLKEFGDRKREKSEEVSASDTAQLMLRPGGCSLAGLRNGLYHSEEGSAAVVPAFSKMEISTINHIVDIAGLAKIKDSLIYYHY